MKYLKYPFFVALAAFLVLSSCASYTALNTLSSDSIFNFSEKGDIIAVAKAFKEEDCQRYLKRNLLAQGYQPVQLCIENKSERSYDFALSRISLHSVEPEEIAKRDKSAAGGAVVYGLTALILPIFAVAAVGSAAEGVKESKSNKNLLSKAARDQVIQPHSHFNKLIFVPINEYRSSFSVTLIDQNSNKKTIYLTAT